MLLEDEAVSERWRVEGRSTVGTEGEAEAEREDDEPAYEMAGESSEAEGERECECELPGLPWQTAFFGEWEVGR